MPDLSAGDEEEGYTSDQAAEALQAMTIKVKSRSKGQKGEVKEKGCKSEAWRMTILRILLDSSREWSARVIDWQML